MRTGPAIIAFLISALLVAAARGETARVDEVRAAVSAEGARVVVGLSAPSAYKLFTLDHPRRVVLDLADTSSMPAYACRARGGMVTAVRSGVQPGGTLRLVIETTSDEEPRVTRLAPSVDGGHRIVIALAGSEAQGAALPVCRARSRRRMHRRRACAMSSSRSTRGMEAGSGSDRPRRNAREDGRARDRA